MWLLIAASIVVVVGAQVNQVVAQPPEAKGLTLSPLRTETTIAPGTSQKASVRVSNTTDEPMVVRLSAEEFRVVNQDYDYAFSADATVASWVIFAFDEVTIAPGKARDITYSINIPLGSEPGGRYLSLFASTDSLSDASTVHSRQRVGSLVYLTVGGDVTRAGALLSLTSPWSLVNDAEWSATIRNSGTTHFRSIYSVTTQTVWGHSVASNEGSALILPGSVRRISDTVPLPVVPGLYKIVYRVGLGDTPMSERTSVVVFLPPSTWILVAGALGIGLVLRDVHGKRRK